MPRAKVVSSGIEIIDNQGMRFIDVEYPMDSIDYGVVSVYKPVCRALLSSRIYQGFGSLSYVTLFEAGPNTCDGSVFRTTQLNSYNLRCFSNDSLSINVTSQACDYWKFISIKEYEPVNFDIYPNPSNGLINIKTDEEIMNVEVYSLDGQKLLEFENTKNIELPGSPGMYVLAIYFEDGRNVVTKVVKE